MQTQSKTISAKIASEITGISYLTIIRAIHNGKISARKPGKEFLIDENEVIEWANKKFEPKVKRLNESIIQQ